MKSIKKSLALLLALGNMAVIQAREGDAILDVRQLNPTTVEVIYAQQGRMTIDFYQPEIIRLFQDNNGGEVRNPAANPPATMLIDNAHQGPITSWSQAPGKPTVSSDETSFAISNDQMAITFDRKTGLFTVSRGDKAIVSQTRPIEYTRSKYTLYLSEGEQEYYYGGGVQNGRFSHRGEQIEIVNTNSWTDGGVASPAPFYWSTGGYGVMCHTFAPGLYDFGKTQAGEVQITHESPYLDLFIMVHGDLYETAESPLIDQQVSPLQRYYQLTGYPVLLPKFAFYEGHLNAYNRDYWLESEAPAPGSKTRGSILFEDGKYYKESQKDNGGIKESLNGEKGNYQFSARAVVDRYERADMPLGWVLPNDGYGAGYGQEETLDGNIENLRQFGEYARSKGVEIGLWTQSDLHPVEGVSALLQRDIVKEVRDAGVRVLKTDVAWVGDGYSFGLNGVADVAQIMPYYGNNARPFIISLDGWAGTHRYASIWSGDQTGGNWEYIRFHIPTYIGAGLSGLGNITSDMDGIFGGGERDVNVRDFQWKTFTPMQLNMDGWGSNPKYPNAFDQEATDINRIYLKFKSMLLPYAYTFSNEATRGGKPLMRPMFMEFPNDYTQGPAIAYQYMFGRDFLVAPIYQAIAEDSQGNDIRNGIYLPEGQWIDYFTGEVYEGGLLLNNFDAPLWKLPLFVRPGAIIPMNLPNNNPSQIDQSRLLVDIYPSAQKNEFRLYDDDGVTMEYQSNVCDQLLISQQLVGKRLQIDINTAAVPSQRNLALTLGINVTSRPSKIQVETQKLPVAKKGSRLALKEVASTEALKATPNSYYYEEEPQVLELCGLDGHVKNPMLYINLASVDFSETALSLNIDGVEYNRPALLASHHGSVKVPQEVTVEKTPYSLTPKWAADEHADYYEIEYGGEIYSTIRDTQLTFGDLQPETSRSFRLRAVNADGKSEWKDITATTDADPLRYAIHGITAKVSADGDPDHEVSRLFDFAVGGDIWFDYMQRDSLNNCLPYILDVDLHCTTQLNELHYLPRERGGNGGIEELVVEMSTDGREYLPVGTYHWLSNDSTHIVAFDKQTAVRYLRLTILQSRGGYVAGREIYVFRTPESKVLIPGDITQDGRIDDADLGSYLNYTGLRKGDSDFEGYVSHADLDGNGLIDAYDISEVATQLEGGIHYDGGTVGGTLSLQLDKAAYQAGEEVCITVKGQGLEAVNAFSLAIPYRETELQYLGIEPLNIGQMQNFTNDRLHKDGRKSLYPTFVNLGDKETLHGDNPLIVIRFKALRPVKAQQIVAEGILVDKFMNQKPAF